MTRVVFGAVCLAHLPYLVWIASGTAVNALRPAAALGALVVLAWSKGRSTADTPVAGRDAAILMTAALALALGGLGWPPLWMASVPLATAGWLVMRGGFALLRRCALLVALGALVFPFEMSWAVLFDPLLQGATAAASVPLLRLTGLEVTLERGGDPVLVAAGLRVTVTSLCAGTQTLLSLMTLGAVVGQVFLSSSRRRALFFALTPVVGLTGNVVRVVLSTHAARQWAWDPVRWQIAHDAIGYGIFAIIYVGLLLLVRRLRRVAAA